MTEQAAYCYSMVIVPLYDTLGANACAFIVNQSEFKSRSTSTCTKSNIFNITWLDLSCVQFHLILFIILILLFTTITQIFFFLNSLILFLIYWVSTCFIFGTSVSKLVFLNNFNNFQLKCRWLYVKMTRKQICCSINLHDVWGSWSLSRKCPRRRIKGPKVAASKYSSLPT